MAKIASQKSNAAADGALWREGGRAAIGAANALKDERRLRG